MMAEPVPSLIPREARARLLALARRAIRAYVLEQLLPDDSSPRQQGQRRGAFVTLHLAGRLRGCMGRPDSPESLESAVALCAVLAASRDPRFPPVRLHEIDALQIEISILTPPEIVPVVEVFDRLHPGRHGVVVSLGAFRGLLLPQVAAEQGWGSQRFLEETCRKAGLPLGAWRDPEVRIELFTAEVFSEAQYPAGAVEAGP
ncbi:MAG TPA: AmmeMemoRadiSam system protein A [Candidatus Acidoferrales bacterium]|nr:AmmeMemoRadiSam system protein A [Candidatus Acidoferrales bacterium]